MGASTDEFPLLAAHGLYVAETAGNGNCLFHALSDQLFGTQSKHHEIRSRVIEYMRENAELYKGFIDVHPGGSVRRNPKRKNAGGYSSPVNYAPPTPEEIDRKFESHLQQMAKGGTYGDNMEIVAFGAAYGVNVKIYQRDFAYMVTNEQGDKPVVHIAYYTWEHYGTIRNINGPHTGLPNVKPTFVSLEVEKAHKEKLAKMSYVQPWMVNVVMKSLPYIADRATVEKSLEKFKGNVDNAVSELLDLEDQGSISSTQGSSSVERERDSDEESFSGPAKKQDRRMSRASRTVIKKKEEQHKCDGTVCQKSFDDSTTTRSDASTSTKQSQSNGVGHKGVDSADESFDSDYNDNDSAYASASDYSAATKPPVSGVRLKLSQPKREVAETSASPRLRPQITYKGTARPSPTAPARAPSIGRTQQRQFGPKQTRLTQRDKRDIKKAAQKAAAKDRKRGVATGKNVNASSAMVVVNSKNGKENSPILDVGIKTLYI